VEEDVIPEDAKVGIYYGLCLWDSIGTYKNFRFKVKKDWKGRR
jgi:hypothetical protein